MLSDPQTVTISGTAHALPRVQAALNQSTYQSADGTYKLLTKQNGSSARARREIRLQMDKVAADPISAVNKAVSASVYIVIDEPTFGFTDAELIAALSGLVALASDSSYAEIARLLGGEM